VLEQTQVNFSDCVRRSIRKGKLHALPNRLRPVWTLQFFAEAMPLKSESFRQWRTASMAREACADTNAKVEHDSNMNKSVSVRVSMCESVCM